MYIILHTYTLNVPFIIKNVRHTGIEVFGKEYTFSNGGITICKPKKSKIGKYSKSYTISHVQFTYSQFSEILDILGKIYRPNTYNFVYKNCNHFCDDLLQLLCGQRLGYRFMFYSRLGKILGQMKNSGIFCGTSEVSGFSKMDEHIFKDATKLTKWMLKENEKIRDTKGTYYMKAKNSDYDKYISEPFRLVPQHRVLPKPLVNVSPMPLRVANYNRNSPVIQYSYNKIDPKMKKAEDPALKSIYSFSTACTESNL